MFQRAVQAFQNGNMDLSAAECQRMLSIDRRNTAAMHILGSVAFRQGDHERAVELLGKVVKQDPGRIQAVITLGEAQLALSRFSLAAINFRKAVAARPDDWGQHYNLGLALRGLGQLDEAATVFEKCRDMAEAEATAPAPWNALGDVYRAQGRLDEARACFEQALRISPNFSMAQNNLGLTLNALGRIAEAISMLEKAIAMNPQDPELHYNLGCSLQDDGQTLPAIAAHRQAIALRPDYAAAHWNLSHSLLRAGEFAEGWREYEWRWQTVQTADTYSQPAWTGDAAAGRTLLIWEEQGLGDTIQFIRFAPLLAKQGWKVVVVVQKPLKRLLDGLPGVEIVARGEALPHFDVHAPMLSLPRLLGVTADAVPAPAPYLAADSARIALWAERLGSREGMRVGLVWQGNPTAKVDKGRSIPLACLAPLAAIPGVRLISLQKNEGVEQLDCLPAGMTVETLGADFDAGPGAFLDSAAVMMNLDLVVTSDTAIAHLAGALGRPVWVLLQAVPDWRWLDGRADCPWYSNMRLFHQEAAGDWDGLAARVAAELSRFK
ncbi:tetratricopeptide repeat protein [Magnetospirillum sp. XM-1]|uniref:tetratricopeptide repeat-containing glycosyltransferase family protein n=1 Tax=Magnetospirillum sp. XM-1 TaxID=1663591 RepID=UPI0021013FFD|nr:tetratricopeptide repeat-containing glycosyltransferase family protein [Magnetospirillum sp. XM-1]